MVADPTDRLTPDPDSGRDALLNARPSLLPFDTKDMMAIRVRPAAFGKMCGVTRQSVSQWAKKGWISIGPDGLLDPVAATRQLLARADPTRIRAQLFREATASLGDLRARIQSLESELAGERALAAAYESGANNAAGDESAMRLSRFTASLSARFDEGLAAQQAGTLGEWVDELVAVEYYGEDLATYRAMITGEEDPGNGV